MKRTKFVAAVAAVGLLAGAYATPLMAFSFGVGGSFGGSLIEIDGSQTMNHRTADTKMTRKKDLQAVLASAYAQIIVGEDMFGEGNGFALGYEQGFGEGKVAETIKHGQAGDTGGNSSARTNINSIIGGIESGDQRAEGILKNLNTVFIETPGFTPLGIFLKAGWSEMDIITNEDLYTGGTYGDGAVDGSMWGFGFKKSAGGFQVKTEFNYTDWDTLSLTNTGTDAGASKVTVAPEQWSGKLTIGYNF